MRLFSFFFEKVHCWYPFLDPPSCITEYTCPVPERSAWYCKFLLIMALGSLAEDDRPTRGLNFAEQYAHPAFSMLPTIVSSGGLLAAQCLILIRCGPTNILSLITASIVCGFSGQLMHLCTSVKHP
jgi:hypothetical protein